MCANCILGSFSLSYTEICIFDNFLTLLEVVIPCELYKSNFVILYVSMTIAHKFETEIWKSTENFSLWCQRMRALLLQQKCAIVLDESLGTKISAYRKQELDKVACSSFFLYLSDNVIRKVGETTTETL